MNRRHARPWTAHERARGIRHAAAECTQYVALVVLFLLVILAAAAVDPTVYDIPPSR